MFDFIFMFMLLRTYFDFDAPRLSVLPLLGLLAAMLFFVSDMVHWLVEKSVRL